MKKILVFFVTMVLSIFIFTGAGCKKSDIRDNVSEITKEYFQGVNEEGKIVGSISVGQRENPYIIDGIHQSLCDFSLITLKIESIHEEEIEVKLYINNNESSLKLYFHPVNYHYMNDLGYNLNENDEIKIEYNNQIFSFSNISKIFKVDYNKALDIAISNLSNEIEMLYEKNVFQGECYLKILSEQSQDFDKLFWHFSITTRDNKIYNLVINVKTEEVILIR